jgi:hypothetical protein
VPRAVLLLALALYGAACNEETSATLFVDLRTDLAAPGEFARVETALFARAPPSATAPPDRTETHEAAGGEDFVAGTRVAELARLEGPSIWLRVRLLEAAGSVAIERWVRVRLAGNQVVTVVITRDCRGVVCAGSDTDPTAQACVGGTCVDPECTPETPEACAPAECATDDDCRMPPIGCAGSIGVEGACFDLSCSADCTAGESSSFDSTTGGFDVAASPTSPHFVVVTDRGTELGLTQVRTSLGRIDPLAPVSPGGMPDEPAIAAWDGTTYGIAYLDSASARARFFTARIDAGGVGATNDVYAGPALSRPEVISLESMFRVLFVSDGATGDVLRDVPVMRDGRPGAFESMTRTAVRTPPTAVALGTDRHAIAYAVAAPDEQIAVFGDAGGSQVTVGASDLREPSMAWDGTELAVAWEAFDGTTSRIQLARFDRTGASLGEPVDVSDPGAARSASIAAGRTSYVVAWLAGPQVSWRTVPRAHIGLSRR